MVETKWHFINECATYEVIHGEFDTSLKDTPSELSEDTRLHKTSNFLFRMNQPRQKSEYGLSHNGWSLRPRGLIGVTKNHFISFQSLTSEPKHKGEPLQQGQQICDLLLGIK